jgi:hypothetical protein
MIEVIREALIWVVGWVLEREPQGLEPFRLLLLIAFSAFVTWLGFYWRSLALRSPSLRKRMLPEERYAGRYLQAVDREDGLRYSIIRIFYNPRRRRFEASGRNYEPSGEKVSAFTSAYLIFPTDGENAIQFVWKGDRAASGHTLMALENEEDDGYVEGSGRIQIFGDKPTVLPIRFKQLHPAHVESALGAPPPVHSAGEPAFIKAFHAKFGKAVKAGFENVAEEV